MSYSLRLFSQFFIFVALFLATHFVMGQEDMFEESSFADFFGHLFLVSLAISAACVIVINLPTLYSNNFVLQLTGFLLGFLQIHLNFSYLEYFITFKTPLIGEDIIYLNNPSAVWLIAGESILNMRFVYFVLIPGLLLSITCFKRSSSLLLPTPRKRTSILVIIFLSGLLSYQGRVLLEKGGRLNWHPSIGTPNRNPNRNSLIVSYEEIANYLRFYKKNTIPTPESLVAVRSIIQDREQRKFTRTDFPLTQSSSHLFPELNRNLSNPPSAKNIIVLMFESLPAAEIYAISKQPAYAGATPFFGELIEKSVLFENAYASGIHTFFGFTDLLGGLANFNYLDWNRKINTTLYHALPFLLRRNGYQAVNWYNGARATFDKMISFAFNAGFNKSYFLKDFPKQAKKSNWGISDREVFLKAARDIKEMKEPFFTFVLGLTKHGPWNTPPDFDHAGFKRDYLKQHPNGTPVDGSRNTSRLLYYANQVLREFFQTLEDDPKFQNSIVIVTSDQAYFPDLKSSNQSVTLNHGFKIPLIYYEPGINPRKAKVFASHLDIIPTLIHRLNLQVPNEVPYLGKDLFNPVHEKQPDLHSHISFWNGKMLHFRREGVYQQEITPESQPWLLGVKGSSIPSKNEPVNQMLDAYQNIYSYLMQNDLIFTTPEQN